MKPLSRRTLCHRRHRAAPRSCSWRVNIVADTWLTTARLDLTAERARTRSAPGTRNIIAKLQEPVTLQFYYLARRSRPTTRRSSAYAKRVRDLLQEYAALSHGKIILQEIDPEPFTPAEDEATAQRPDRRADRGRRHGLFRPRRHQHASTARRSSRSSTPEREHYLEYDLTSLIYQLSTPQEADAGNHLQPAARYRARAACRRRCRAARSPTRSISSSARSTRRRCSIPSFDRDSGRRRRADDRASRRRSARRRLYAIDQFVLRGGRALVFVDPNSELAKAGCGHRSARKRRPRIRPARSSSSAWGVGYDPEKVIGDRALAQRVQVSADPRNPVARYPVWLHLDAKHFDRKDQVTGKLAVAQSGKRRRAASAQGRDHDISLRC